MEEVKAGNYAGEREVNRFIRELEYFSTKKPEKANIILQASTIAGVSEETQQEFQNLKEAISGYS